jgi:hypothetical protein
MKYSDQLEINGRTYQIEGGSAGTGSTGTGSTGTAGAGPELPCELTVRAEDVGAGPVEVRVVAPAGDLALVSEIVQRSLTGLAHLAGAGGGSR